MNREQILGILYDLSLTIGGELDLDSPSLSSATLQLKNSYILTPSRDGLMVIDQHRAHKQHGVEQVGLRAVAIDGHSGRAEPLNERKACQKPLFPQPSHPTKPCCA